MDVNIFLAFTREDNELKELTAKKIETWNKAHSSLGLTFHPYDWLTDSTPETRAEHRDGQFFINKQNIDKCELMFALIINGTGTPGEYEGKYYPCATLYEVNYHRNRGKRACIFLNNDEPRQKHFQFATENGMGLFWCGDEVKFKETIYEKIDQILMQYIMQPPNKTPLPHEILLLLALADSDKDDGFRVFYTLPFGEKDFGNYVISAANKFYNKQPKEANHKQTAHWKSIVALALKEGLFIKDDSTTSCIYSYLAEKTNIMERIHLYKTFDLFRLTPKGYEAVEELKRQDERGEKDYVLYRSTP